MKKCRILVRGENLQSFLNALSNRKIVLFDVVFEQDSLLFSTNYKNANKILELYSRSNYEISVVKAPKYANIKEFFLKNLGILIAVCFIYVACFAYTNHIWQFKVYGLQNVEYAQVVQAIEDSGVAKGASKASIDTQTIENAILHNIDGVALASVNIVGTTLIVTISEKINNDAVLDNTNPIVSQYDCVITSIKTTAGTALVSVGDRVAKGQTIIANYVIDSQGNHIASKASGQVYADVYHTYNKTYFSKDAVLQRSGKTYTYNDVYICGIPVLSKNKSGFERYEIETSTQYLSSPIPIKVVKHTVYELVEAQVDVNLNDTQALLEQTIELAKEQLNITEADDIITCLSNNGDSITISVSFVTNQKII